MAETALQVVVSPLLGSIFDNLTSPILNEFGLIWGVNKELEKLSNTLSLIRLVLQDAEMKQIQDAETRDWLRKLKDAAYEADDIIDVCDSFSTCFDFKNMILRHKIGKQIRHVREKFDDIAAQRIKFHFKEGGLEFQESNSNYRETSSILCEPHIYGRVEDQEKILDFLLGDVFIRDEIPVYPIVGIGGIGKTTLAKLVYNDERVVRKFDTRIWICVSEDFGVKRLTKMIVESLLGKICKLENLDPMQNRLKELLHEKKFLLVLDDVWNENPDKWDQVRFVLKSGAKGSSIIVTTRQLKVAAIMSKQTVHNLTALSEDECWSLFRGRTFGEGSEDSGHLEVIGKQIVKKCRGVPLAAKALGGLLRFEREARSWISVRDSDIWELPQDNEGGILPSLRLSYNHLPSQLRQCFAYCSLLPKDYRIDKEELIHLWMANGFLQSDGRMDLEDIGEQIFNELASRSFFQDVEKDYYGNIQYCKMHDLMHDLACSVTLNECCACVVEGRNTIAIFPPSIRHLSVTYLHEMPQNALTSLSISHPFLRTCLLLSSSNTFWFTSLDTFFKNLECIRALDLRGTRTPKLPVEIGRMKHLRYLNLSSTDLTLLPESICNLRNLQTLNLCDCSQLRMLPKYTRNLTSLRHLVISGCQLITQLPVAMGKLICLRTLGLFIVRQESGRSIKELHGLDHLRGELMINGLEHVQNTTEAKEANLARKKNLSSLSLEWGSLHDKAEWVLEGLQPSPHLSVLVIIGYGGSVFPIWMKFLENLVEIELRDCFKCEHLPPLGQLPCLKVLNIRGMESLKCISSDFYGTTSEGGNIEGSFPLLEKLTLWEMPNFEVWHTYSSLDAKENQTFPCLTKLNPWECPKLVLLPFVILPRVQHLEVHGCEQLEVRSLLRLTSLCYESVSSFPERSLQNLDALESLVIDDCSKLTSIPEELQNLTSLTSLAIDGCDELISLPEGLRELASLNSLCIERCKSLKSLPRIGIQGLMSSLVTLKVEYCEELISLPEGLGNLPSLKSIKIQHCDALKSLPVLGVHGLMSSLVNLEISYCDSLTSLSQGLQYLPVLEKLYVSSCNQLQFSNGDFEYLTLIRTLQLEYLPKLTSLPELQHLSALQTLEILSCENLKILPQDLQKLTSLHTLKIGRCHPDFHVRSEKEKGDYWSSISHIPQLEIMSSYTMRMSLTIP